MKSVAIFIHSVRQVFGNFEAALQISLVLFLAQLGVVFALGMAEVVLLGVAPPAPSPDETSRMLLVLLCNVFVALWIAVSWHRFVLTSERPPGLLPVFRGERILSYLGHSLLVAVLMLPAMFIAVQLVGPLLMGLVMQLTAPQFWHFIVIMAVVFVPLIALFTRLSVILPAAALGKPLTLAEAWGKTAGTLGTFAFVGVMFVVAGAVIDWPGQKLLAVNPLLATLWMAASYWVKMMVGLSLMTTVYGHYIEGRPLVTQAG